MASQCLFHGDRKDVVALISTVEASCPQSTDFGMDSVSSWNSLASDLAASYLAGDALRWYEELDTATQESWASLRASLLAKFVTDNDDAHNNELNQSRYVQDLQIDELSEHNFFL